MGTKNVLLFSAAALIGVALMIVSSEMFSSEESSRPSSPADPTPAGSVVENVVIQVVDEAVAPEPRRAWEVRAPCVERPQKNTLWFREHRLEPRDPSRPFFYLHEPYDPEPVMKCLSRVQSSYAEHMQDSALLLSFREHSLRTEELEKASVHVIGYPTFGSWAIPEGCAGNTNHTERMDLLARALRDLFVEHQHDRRPWLFVNTWKDLPRLLGPYLTSTLRIEKIILLASNPHSAATLSPQILRGKFILIPPVIDETLDRRSLAILDTVGCASDLESRQTPATFHSRKTGAAFVNLTSSSDEDFLEKLHLASNDSPAPISSTSTASMASAKFCMVAEGSRYFMEALAAGCFPIRFAYDDSPMPFSNEVDYASMALFAGPIACATSNKTTSTETEKWLRRIASPVLRDVPDSDAAAFWTSRVCQGQQAFRVNLSFRSGLNVASAILRRFGLDAPADIPSAPFDER